MSAEVLPGGSGLLDSSRLYFFAFVAVFLVVYYYGRKYARMIQLSAKIPGPDMLTMMKLSVGTLNAEPHDVFKHVYGTLANFKDIAKVWVGPKLLIFLRNPADIELILSSNVHIDKSNDYTFFRPWFGNGLLISTGPKWKHHRKMIAPTFHQSILKNFVSTFYSNSIKVTNKMKNHKGKTFDAHDYMSGTTVDILLETAMGYNVPRSAETGHNYAMAVVKLSDIIHRRHYKVWLRPDLLFQKSKYALEHSRLLNIVTGLTSKVVANKKKDVLKKGMERMETYSSETFNEALPNGDTVSHRSYGVGDDLDFYDENDIGQKKRLAFLDQLTVNAQRDDVDFTEKEVMDQVNTIMFEGHDTTAAGSSFTLCMLGLHKEIQEKVIQEIDDIFQKTDRECTFADTMQMKYLERVIMESLRMYPPVPVIARQLKEEVKCASGDYSLPIDTTVLINMSLLHRRPDTFPNPDVFNPDNFLPEKCQDRHYYSYIPFSAGPRSCVGRKFAMLKLKVMLSTILRNCRVHCDIPQKDFKLQADLILKMTGGFNIRVEERKDVPVQLVKA